MERRGIRKNNRGDSLILVIGCIALISILGVVLLAKSLDNQAMKQAEEKAQSSFFAADSSTAEMVTVLESMAQDAVEEAFSDMMIEYSLGDDGTGRMERYGDYFEASLKKALEDKSLQDRLKEALEVTELTDLEVEFTGTINPPEPSTEAGKTDVLRIPEVKFSYTADGLKTKITTDICVQAKIPNVEAGFQSGIHCDFSDFSLITDASTTVTDNQYMTMNGNVYVGGSLSAGNVQKDNAGVVLVNEPMGLIQINNASKVLVHDDIRLEEAGEITVTNSSQVEKGLGIWANGVDVRGGEFTTDKINLYVADDLTIGGTAPSVIMKGDASEYVGYSNGDSTLPNYRRSSAITINNSSDLILDLHELKRLVLSGVSYIRDDVWTDKTAGVLQGESVAYKDMQSMYLFPGSCLTTRANPVLGNETIDVTSYTYTFPDPDGLHGESSINLEPFLNTSNPFITRTIRADGGMTEATHVYLNFKDEKSAAEYVQLYMSTVLGEEIQDQVANLNKNISSKILLAMENKTLFNAITYDGTTASMLPGVDLTNKIAMEKECLGLKQKYRSLFSSLRTDGGSFVSSSYKLLKNGIIRDDLISPLAGGERENFPVYDSGLSAEEYRFVLYKGDLDISSTTSPYRNLKGILLVDGDLTLAATGVQIEGLVLVTGEVKVSAGATLTANAHIVDTMLADERVAKYFRSFAEETSESFLSSESVSISFENWKKN